MSMLKEFKDFALRGNVVDMAVGVVIGAAFGKIVSSLVSDIIMPPLGYILGGIDFPISSCLCPECPFLPWLKPRKWESLSLPMVSS